MVCRPNWWLAWANLIRLAARSTKKASATDRAQSELSMEVDRRRYASAGRCGRPLPSGYGHGSSEPKDRERPE